MSKQTKRSKWQAIVDDSLLKTNQVTQAAIYGLDGTRWASTPDLQVTPEQIHKIVACITGEDSSMKKNGIKLGTQHYIFLKSEHLRSIYGRKGTDCGVCIIKTVKGLVIGTYGLGIQPMYCSSVIEKLADYLIQHGT